MGEFNLTAGQSKYLRMVHLYGEVGNDRSWWASVRHGIAQFRAHRAAVKELGDWLPWHDRPENAPPITPTMETQNGEPSSQ